MRARGELTDLEEDLLGIERPSEEDEAQESRDALEKTEFRRRFLHQLMESSDFREWLMEQLTGFGTFDRTFAVSPTGFPDQAATEFHLGMKAAGWYLWEQVDDIAPDLASLMRREALAPKLK